MILDNIIFAGVIPTATTRFLQIPLREGVIGLHIAWKDATSAATFTLELTSFREAALTSVVAWEWAGSGVAITGPNATAAGSSLVNVENVRQAGARLKVVTTAQTTLEIRDVRAAP